ncbi:MAG: YjbE family putative metal transport protein [Desulfitobacteriia bacterium]
MGLTFSQFITGLISIIIIDLVLAGDNAIVIGLACRNLPDRIRLKAIILGTGGAVIIRILATLAVVWLLRIKGLMLGGGLLLVWISYKLLTKEQDDKKVKEGNSLLTAIITIIVADAVMGIDNVLAIAGASHGSYVLVIIGLIISIPIMILGSTFIIKLMNRFPIIIEIGAGIIAYTAGKMITSEPFLPDLFRQPEIKYTLIALIIIGVLAAGRLKKVKKLAQSSR